MRNEHSTERLDYTSAQQLEEKEMRWLELSEIEG